MTMRILAIVAAFGLASCGGAGQPLPQAQDKGPAPETGAALKVAQLDADQREMVLEKAIRASGAACPAVRGVDRDEVRKGVMGWKVQCNDGTAHLVEISADGTAQVTSRR